VDVDIGSSFDALSSSQAGLSSSDDPNLGSAPSASSAPAAEPVPAVDDASDAAAQAAIDDIHLRHLRIAREFIDALKDASLEKDGLEPEILERLRNPPTQPLVLDDLDVRLSIETYFATFRSAQRTYREVREAFLQRYPDSKMLSYEQVEKLLAELTGIYPVEHHMCPNACAAFTGPWAALTKCPECQEERYDSVKSRGKAEPVPRQTFLSIPVALQIQAMLRSSVASEAAGYRARYTEQVFDEIKAGLGRKCTDLFDADDYRAACARGDIGPDDIVMVSSEDGAQLYRNKESDVWFLIWIIFNFSPDMRYKKKYILVDTIIPSGKVKPKFLDSFLYPSLHHVAAVQNMNDGAGLPLWNASQPSRPVHGGKLFVAMNTADSPGMAAVNGLVGHTGARGCILFCDLCGRRKPGGTTYYPALLRPDNYDVVGCDHEDVDPTEIRLLSEEAYRAALKFVEESRTQAEYEERRKATGIAKASLFDGLRAGCSFGVPRMFPLDLMHLASLNIPDLLLALWRGTIPCGASDSRQNWPWMVLTDQIWMQHGDRTGAARTYIPSCHDCAPRNIAEKINSGYKAKEHQTHLYSLCPGFLHTVLPDQYWSHFCKLVRVMRIMHQYSHTEEELALADRLALEFDVDFEVLYVQGRSDRLHFVRPCLHKLIHVVPQARRLGPLPLYSQWAMERTIGNLTEEIRQDSNPYMNLSMQAVRRARCNALQMLLPALDRDNRAPSVAKGSRSLGNGYWLKPAYERTPRRAADDEEGPIASFIAARGGLWTKRFIQRWARARLPSGDVVRGLWKEKSIALKDLRARRFVKVKWISLSDYRRDLQ
jgi:hypothetical protein